MKKIIIPVLLTGLLYITWGCGENTKSKLFDSQDTLSYNIVKLEKKEGACLDEFSNCATINISYPEFYSDKNDSVIITINNFIKKAILYYSYGDEAALSIDELITQFVENYKDFLLESPEYNVAWEQTNNTKVIMNKSNILCLELFDYDFMGGAHPNTLIAYENFNSKTGQKIYLPDLFVENYEPYLDKIAEKIFRDVREIPEGATYDTLGFWFDKNVFILTDNFAISETGLVFLYNSYEIAPYAWGQTKLEIPYADLKEIIKPDGLLGEVINSD